MRNIVLAVILICFMGCTTADWNKFMWGDPRGRQETPPQYSAKCVACNRVFSVSQGIVQNNKQVVCPYCGATQDTHMAVNRYAYDSQQQQQATNQAFWQMRQEYLQERQEVLQKASDERIKILSEKSPTRQNVQVQPAVNSPTHTDCTPNLSGGFNCKSW